MKSEPTKVFIVDDHPMLRELLAGYLRLQPDMAVVGEAEEAAPALAAMQAAPPDVAVVDLSLKRGSGLELIKELHGTLPSVLVVVLSMHEEIADVERAFRAGARGYVMKRESTGQILEAIRQVRAGKTFVNAESMAKLADRIVVRTKDAAAGPPEILSDRELEVFRRLGAGQSTREISEALSLGLKTVQTYCDRIKDKLGLADGRELTRAALRWHDSRSAL